MLCAFSGPAPVRQNPWYTTTPSYAVTGASGLLIHKRLPDPLKTPSTAGQYCARGHGLSPLPQNAQSLTEGRLNSPSLFPYTNTPRATRNVSQPHRLAADPGVSALPLCPRSGALPWSQWYGDSCTATVPSVCAMPPPPPPDTHMHKSVLESANPRMDSECASGCTWSTARATAPSPGRPTPGVVKQHKSSGGSVDTTKTRSGPQRVRMSSGERPIGAAKGEQPITEALCQPPPPPVRAVQHQPHSQGTGPTTWCVMRSSPTAATTYAPGGVPAYGAATGMTGMWRVQHWPLSPQRLLPSRPQLPSQRVQRRLLPCARWEGPNRARAWWQGAWWEMK